MDVEPTLAHRTAEVESTKTMIDRVEARFDIKPERLIGDTAYGTAPMLAWMVGGKDIEPHVPVWDKPSARTTVSRATISTGMKRLRNTAARPVTYYAANGVPSRTSVRTSQKPAPSSSDQTDRLRDNDHEALVKQFNDSVVSSKLDYDRLWGMLMLLLTSLGAAVVVLSGWALKSVFSKTDTQVAGNGPTR
ncbi:hypothetical protein PS914_04538 [Pseudomonas fluorescens]|uniref:Transposase IS4-like domain-containing protein n=1 Tax=Pseudomonas fluorescens TaxID=294 RepID=A0A5E7U479_PSEFL|nr:hypothetical protein PS833_03804 [Pseudomonas fluorescens]VVQ05681.1 hypothetical protein PS914_04538 [Pseudomonas fluorescens]